MCVSAHFEIRAGRAVVYFLLQSFSINYYNMLHVFFSTSEGEEAVLLKERLKERKGLIGRVVFFLFIFLCVFIINNNGSSCPLEQTTWSIYSVFFLLLLSSFMIFKYISIDFTAKLAALLQVWQLSSLFFSMCARGKSERMLHILGYWTGKILAMELQKSSA